MPTTMSVNTIAPPARTLALNHGRSQESETEGLVADSRVNERIKGIDNKVNGYKGNGVNQNEASHERVIAGVHTGDEQAPDPRPGEDRFHDDRPAEQRAHLEADYGDDRN